MWAETDSWARCRLGPMVSHECGACSVLRCGRSAEEVIPGSRQEKSETTENASPTDPASSQPWLPCPPSRPLGLHVLGTKVRLHIVGASWGDVEMIPACGALGV
ncbi:hypothetical protein NDU88_002319 [Pleurodeles waltl]|uniref:Uncharacterized protein n=1 Tax=Pleurodeles waltl TaxID=8319 RepID=A0AAV7RCE4_PLEWA|nr:hypothetical protein NDU88_002319 [Pleurodeles waltl]